MILRKIVAYTLLGFPYATILFVTWMLGGVRMLLMWVWGVLAIIASVAGAALLIWTCCAISDAYRWAWRTVRKPRDGSRV